MSFLKLTDVTKFYGSTCAVQAMNLTVQKGEFVSLLGPSGCGKTTTLQMVAGFEPVTSGRIELDGKDITHAKANTRGLGIVFQSYALFPHMTVAANVSFGLEMRKVPKAERAERVAQALALVHLEAHATRYPRELSGGQSQRVALARALVIEPPVLLLDEPLSNLDAKLRVEMRAEIKRLHQASGITSVYVTHDQVEAMTLGSRIAVMKGGVVQQLGTPDEIYNRPANTYVATFIGSPTMNLLRGAATGGQFGIQGAALNLAPPASSANEVLLGVRPEHLVMQDSAPWRGKVSVVEPTGPDTYVMVDTAAGSVTLRTDAQTRVQPGDAVGLAVEPANAHWFDASSENRLA